MSVARFVNVMVILVWDTFGGFVEGIGIGGDLEEGLGERLWVMMMGQ